MKRTLEEVITILKNVNRKHDCTDPTGDFAEKIGFDRDCYSGINFFLSSEDDKLVFYVELVVPYESSDWVALDVDDPILDQFLKG